MDHTVQAVDIIYISWYSLLVYAPGICGSESEIDRQLIVHILGFRPSVTVQHFLSFDLVHIIYRIWI